jgi:cellulose synthase/poly-beta-1,6-N-acetylglucosamine synthase-like glycosyltransferase
MSFTISNFVRPERYDSTFFDVFSVRVAAIVPTYKPGDLTVKLIKDIVAWNPEIQIYVVDDCTPETYAGAFPIFQEIAGLGERVTLMRTPVNRLKAGALNFALRSIFLLKKSVRPEVVVTLDDDVVINQHTIRNLVIELMRHEKIGAVCSQCLVYNRTKNILTRLQSLEYQGFNATRLADEGFFGGPLVMHGMLTAFRTRALKEVGGFKEKHLIEDYEITARLKERGWHVKSAVNAKAWTLVPETLTSLWRQRTRWSYGGMMVVASMNKFVPVIQDVIGHGVFIATILMINAMLFLSGDGVPHVLADWILVVAFVHLGIWYGFQMWLMRLYRERDAFDWVIRGTLILEFVYSNVMTLVLIGSYLFFGFNLLARAVSETSNTALQSIIAFGRRLFLDFGYTEGWGTRAGS